MKCWEPIIKKPELIDKINNDVVQSTQLNNALEVLRRYQKWEADALNSDDPSVFDDMNDKLYNDWMEIQNLRELVLSKA